MSDQIENNGLTPEQAAAFNERNAIKAEAHNEPLPGSLADGLCPGPIQWAGRELQPLTAGHLQVLRMIESPVRSALLSGTESVVTETDLVAALYVLSTPIAKARPCARSGKEAFEDKAMMELGDGLSALDLADGMKAIKAAFIQGFSTRVSYQNKSGDGESVVFPKG